MLVIIILLPIVGFLVSGLLGRFLGYNSSKYIATICIIIPTILVYYIYYIVIIYHTYYTVVLQKWICIDNIEILWSFTIDEISATLLIPIFTISSLVHIYSIAYMAHDPHQQRFFSILSLFTAFMVILVTGNNFLVMFVGWELIGVASYLLISFWYTRISAMKSGLSAILVNKIGDTILTIGILLILYTYGTLDYSTVNTLSMYTNIDIMNIIMVCILLGAAAKSAQLGLHTWLLNSMEGPTPVSSLLHAACLVCAGIYLLLRSTYILEYTPTILLVILWLGGITTLVSGLIAIVSNDIKKIIALSTMSQLGIMVVSIGLSYYSASMYHLLCHAMFKALLFMAAGSIIHSIVYESQDIRYYGSYIHFLPVTYICITIASLSLMAVPGLSGYYSKDIIIETTYCIYTISGYILYYITLCSASLTTLYSIRLLYLVFFNIPNSNKYTYYTIQESSYTMLVPMIILCILSIVLGYVTKDIYLGMGSNFYSILNHNNTILLDMEYTLPTIYKILPLLCTVLCTTIVFIVYEYYYSIITIYNSNILRSIYVYANSKFLIDQILNNIILRSMLYFSMLCNMYVDRGILYIYGPRGLYNAINIMSYNILYNTSYSKISHYKSPTNITIYIPFITILSLLLLYTTYTFITPYIIILGIVLLIS
uniref:NADH-ubiquinone oxidoreductase chain 5 n=1 Tax=Diddensiella santjacobensis TaxID=2704139 RepID=S5TMT1_9ASCO|nr:NADH dehydrogenase subunit 5 [Diddensiella santjacobensis]AGS44125.1 NADH dehydrogenase subunit 5 [Diddensiella santjacobensis]